MAVPLQKRLRRDLRSRALQAVIRLASLLPLRALLALGGAVGRLAWRLGRANRRQMLEGLAAAFPERSAAEREAIGEASLRHLGWLAAEVLGTPRDEAWLRGYVSFAGDGEQRLHAHVAAGRGLLFLTGHVGNWELMARRVAQGGIPSATIAKATHDPRMNELMGRLRAEGGVTTLWREDPSTARAMLRVFKEGKALGLLIDQDIRVQGVFVPFFGRPAWTPRAGGDLALRTRAPVVAVFTRRRGPRPADGHEIHVVDIPYDPDAADREAESTGIAARATAVLEQAIRDRPEEWVWMHQRWKTRPGPVAGVPGAAAQGRSPGTPAGPDAPPGPAPEARD